MGKSNLLSFGNMYLGLTSFLCQELQFYSNVRIYKRGVCTDNVPVIIKKM